MAFHGGLAAERVDDGFAALHGVLEAGGILDVAVDDACAGGQGIPFGVLGVVDQGYDHVTCGERPIYDQATGFACGSYY